MKRMFVLAALVLAGLTGAVLRMPQPASACTGPGPIENLLDSTVIFEGRITAATPSGPPGASLSPHELTFEVATGHKGVASGATVTANAQLRTPGGVPIMCPQFPAEVVGKHVVIGLLPDLEHPGELFTHAWVSYIGDSLSGAEYDWMSRLARMHADSDPAAPQLLITPSTVTCGEPFTVNGRRFPAGKHLLQYGAFANRVIGAVEVGPDGTFEVRSVMFHNACGNRLSNGRNVGIFAMAIGDGPAAWPWSSNVVEVGAVALMGAADRPWPGLLVLPNPAHCSEQLQLAGEGFLPGERLTVSVGDGPAAATIAVDDSGRFDVRVTIPPAACKGSLVDVIVRQADYAQYLPAHVGLASGPVVVSLDERPAPAPPDVGNSAPPRPAPRPIVFAAALIVAAAVAVATIRSGSQKSRR